MKRFGLAIFSLIVLGSAAGADESRYVYEIQQRDAVPSSPWSLNMVAMAEAARLYSPVTFSKRGRIISMTLDTSFSFSLLESTQVERFETRLLIRHKVLLQGQPSLPKASKQSTIRFSLSELVKNKGEHALSPLQYAIDKAIDGSLLKSGKAWIRSCDYSGGRFIVEVALTR